MMASESRWDLCPPGTQTRGGDGHLSTTLTIKRRVRNGALIGHGTSSKYTFPE